MSRGGVGVAHGSIAASRVVDNRLAALRQSASDWQDLSGAPQVVTPGGANLLAGILPITGYTTGTLGSGGVLPTGMWHQTASATKVLNSADGDSIDVSFTAAPGQVYAGGIYFSGYTPAVGDYLMSFTVSCTSTTSNGMSVQTTTYDTVAITSGELATVYTAREGAERRVTSWIPVTNTDQRIMISVRDIDGQTDETARFVFSDFMLVAVPDLFPKYGALLAIPPYGQESTSASDVTINTPAGDHMVLVKTAERGWIAERSTLSAGNNNLSDVFPGASFTAKEVYAIPVSDWKQGDLDVIASPTQWNELQYLNGASSTLSYSPSPPDISQALGQPIGTRIGSTLNQNYAAAMAVERSGLHRFEVRDDDHTIVDNADGNTSNRTELGHDFYVPNDTDVWVSFWVKIDGQVEAGAYSLLVQHRHTENATGDTATLSPPWSLSAMPDNKIECTRRSDEGTPVLSGGPEMITVNVNSDDEGGFGLGPTVSYVPGQWHRTVIRANHSTSGAGSYSWWWDGVQMLNNVGPLGYVKDRGPRVRHGIYRKDQNVTLVTTFQHLEVSTSSLLSRVTAPLPI